MTTPTNRGRPPRLKPVDKHEMRRYREAGVSIAHIAGMFHCSTRRVYEILAQQREMFGPEKLPEHKRHLSRVHLSTGHFVPNQGQQVADTTRCRSSR